MIVYTASCVASMLIAWATLHVKQLENSKPWFKALLACFPLFFIAAFRYDVGQDYLYTYFPYFYRVQAGTVTETLEPAYHLLNVIVAKLGGSVVWVFAISAAIFMMCVFTSIYRESPSPVLSIFLLVGMTYYFIFLNTMRQMIGCGILLYALRFVQKKRFGPFLICVLIASCFHISCFLGIVIYFLQFIRFSPKITLGVTALLLVLSRPLTQLALKIIAMTPYGSYIGSVFDTGEKGYFIIAINAAILLLGMAFYQKNDKFNLYFNLQVVSLWIAAFSGNVALIGRLRWMFGLPGIILIPLILKGIKNGKLRFLAISAVVICFALYTAITIGLRNGNNVLPYQMIWGRNL